MASAATWCDLKKHHDQQIVIMIHMLVTPVGVDTVGLHARVDILTSRSQMVHSVTFLEWSMPSVYNTPTLDISALFGSGRSTRVILVDLPLAYWVHAINGPNQVKITFDFSFCTSVF